MNKKGQFVSTLLASMAANLVWNLDPRDESTVRQFHPPPTHIPQTLTQAPHFESFLLEKVQLHFRAPFVLCCRRPQSFLPPTIYASIHSSNEVFLSYDCRRIPKYFSYHFKFCQIVRLGKKWTPASSLFSISKGFFPHFFVFEMSHEFSQIQFVWIFCLVSNSTFEMWPLRIYGWR